MFFPDTRPTLVCALVRPSGSSVQCICNQNCKMSALMKAKNLLIIVLWLTLIHKWPLGLIRIDDLHHPTSSKKNLPTYLNFEKGVTGNTYFFLRPKSKSSFFWLQLFLSLYFDKYLETRIPLVTTGIFMISVGHFQYSL